MKEYVGGCHCGEVKFKFNSDQAVEIWECNCSICKIHGYEHLFIKHDDFEVTDGKDLISEYSFGTKSKAPVLQKMWNKKFLSASISSRFL